VNGRLQASTNATPAAFYWDTEAVADGSYTLTAKAYDEAGNSAQSASVVVNMKNATTTTTTTKGGKKR